MRRKVYFDRNIFADIKRREGTLELANDIEVLKKAVADDKIKILWSTTLLEETIPAIKNSPATLRHDLKIITDIVDKHRMIKQPGVLLREAIQSYAFERRSPDMLFKTPPVLNKFLINGKVTGNLEKFFQAVITQSEEFERNLANAFSELKRIKEERRIDRPEDFQEFWRGISLEMVGWEAENYKLYDRCVKRGIKGLAEIKIIKLYTIYYASWAYSKWFGEQGIPGKVKASELGDFFHSVQAAAANVFVTHDSRLARWLKQIPIEEFEVISFSRFIEQLQ